MCHAILESKEAVERPDHVGHRDRRLVGHCDVGRCIRAAQHTRASRPRRRAAVDAAHRARRRGVVGGKGKASQRGRGAAAERQVREAAGAHPAGDGRCAMDEVSAVLTVFFSRYDGS